MKADATGTRTATYVSDWLQNAGNDTALTDVSNLSDIKIKAYTVIDRFVPFMYLQGSPRWDGMSYATGIAVLTVISLAVGLIVFNRRELS